VSRDWWRTGVVYQVYPRSFADANGDGDGDLRGIIDHLDHLGPDGLGVDAIWLSPFYRSPWREGGYDVADHTHVDPRFGSEADFDALVEAAHRRGLKVVLDLVLNHTSDEHRWFQESRRDPDGPFGDYYLWRDMPLDRRGKRRGANNWRSFFGGPGWQWDEVRGQGYFHTFLVQQPELNWRAPGVEQAQFDVARSWLDRGVDGFRLDVFNCFLKDPELRSNPLTFGGSGWAGQRHVNDRDHPEFAALIARFRALVDRKPDRMTVGELFDGPTERAAELTSGHHLVFDWELLESNWSADALRAAIDRREAAFHGDLWPTLALSNHDRMRHASRYAASAGEAGKPGIADVDGVARAAAVLLLGLRGTPFLYYGEEIGARDVDITPEESVDPPAAQLPGWWDRSRCRTPMPWTDEPGAGFSSGRPWLRLAPDAATRNVAAQVGDPASIFATYRRLIAARRESPALSGGSFEWLPSGHRDVLAWRRVAGDDRAIVILNIADRSVEVTIGAGGRVRAAIGTHLDPPVPAAAPSALPLRPLEGIVAFLEPG
jgi:alpha-glucosidase